MLPPEALRSMRVMFATPTYLQATTSGFSASMFLLGAECVKVGLQAQLEMRGDSIPHYARNLLVAKFLESDCTHLVFWDADVMPDSMMQVFRLLLADKDVAAGVYPIKEFNWPEDGVPAGVTMKEWEERSATYPFFPIASGQEGRFETDEDGFAAAQWATTGFMCIKRVVFYKLMTAYPNLNFVPNGPVVPGKAHLYWRFFQHLIEPTSNRELPEDYSFCKLWRDIGGTIWEDTQSVFSHYGQHVYRGDLMAKLEHGQSKQERLLNAAA